MTDEYARCSKCGLRKLACLMSREGKCLTCEIHPLAHHTRPLHVPTNSRRKKAACSCGMILYTRGSRARHKKIGHVMLRYSKITDTTPLDGPRPAS